MQEAVGIIGLGIMGSSFARHLIAAGKRVVGYDPLQPPRDRHAAIGGDLCDSAADVAESCGVILTCLPSEAALISVVSGSGGLSAARNTEFVLVECSTLSVAAKSAAAERLRRHGSYMLDCPVSGTGAQASNRDVVFYASGDEDTFLAAEPWLALLGRKTYFLGEFGNGTRMKLLSNLLVAIHNVAAAEAIALARKAGMDLDTMVQAVGAGAGTSRMFEVRGPMMASGRFNTGDSSRLDVFQKDLQAIAEFCDEAGAAAPVFSLCHQLYRSAIAEGWSESDPGVVYRVIEQSGQARGSGMD